ADVGALVAQVSAFPDVAGPVDDVVVPDVAEAPLADVVAADALDAGGGGVEVGGPEGGGAFVVDGDALHALERVDAAGDGARARPAGAGDRRDRSGGRRGGGGGHGRAVGQGPRVAGGGDVGGPHRPRPAGVGGRGGRGATRDESAEARQHHFAACELHAELCE